MTLVGNSNSAWRKPPRRYHHRHQQQQDLLIIEKVGHESPVLQEDSKPRIPGQSRPVIVGSSFLVAFSFWLLSTNNRASKTQAKGVLTSLAPFGPHPSARWPPAWHLWAFHSSSQNPRHKVRPANRGRV